MSAREPAVPRRSQRTDDLPLPPVVHLDDHEATRVARATQHAAVDERLAVTKVVPAQFERQRSTDPDLDVERLRERAVAEARPVAEPHDPRHTRWNHVVEQPVATG